jgi:hypothetical protein
MDAVTCNPNEFSAWLDGTIPALVRKPLSLHVMAFVSSGKLLLIYRIREELLHVCVAEQVRVGRCVVNPAALKRQIGNAE